MVEERRLDKRLFSILVEEGLAVGDLPAASLTRSSLAAVGWPAMFGSNLAERHARNQMPYTIGIWVKNSITRLTSQPRDQMTLCSAVNRAQFNPCAGVSRLRKRKPR
jgi:hypothetical protein